MFLGLVVRQTVQLSMFTIYICNPPDDQRVIYALMLIYRQPVNLFYSTNFPTCPRYYHPCTSLQQAAVVLPVATPPLHFFHRPPLDGHNAARVMSLAAALFLRGVLVQIQSVLDALGLDLLAFPRPGPSLGFCYYALQLFGRL